jgi:hypothetical protein
MAEISLYLTENDELPIVTLALQLGCNLVPDLHYSTPKYEPVGTVERYKQYRARTRAFYLTSSIFLRCPLELRRIEKENKTVYYIENAGCPSIYFLGGGLFVEADSQFVRPGIISHRAKFWNQSNGEMERPPTELVDTYKALQKLIRSSFRHSKPGKVSFWLGPEAVQAVQNGTKVVGFEKYSAQELLKRSQQARKSAHF